MIFSKKEVTTCYTVTKCTSCQMETRRKFEKNDYVFNNASKCSSCDGNMIIVKIFGETIEQ